MTHLYRVEVRPTTHTEDAVKGLSNLYGALALDGLQSIRLFFLRGTLTTGEVTRFCREALADPVTETFTISDSDSPSPLAERGLGGEVNLRGSGAKVSDTTHMIEVTYLPGVTDTAAANIVRAGQVLGIDGLSEAATGTRYELTGMLTLAQLKLLAVDVFSNPVIQRYTVDQPISAPFMDDHATDKTVETIPLRDATDDALKQISKSRRLALDLAEMSAIRAYYVAESREPTDAELEMIAQTWSEHCVHKTFKAEIAYNGPLPGKYGNAQPQTIDGLLKTYLRAATDKLKKPWVLSAFVDNAGIIAFNDAWDVAFKVETHNHPSALEPFGGANTGVGGVVRDVLGVSARPIANTDVLCFGTFADTIPAGVLSPARVEAGVVQGIEDYGNKMGIPTVNGAVFYHPGYTANPLVFCGCIGILPHGSHVTGAKADDLIVVIGGRTGRDGLRGATFSSAEMDDSTAGIAGSSVQIGHPIHEKQVQEVILRARDARLYRAITDCGAGGLSSAVGEMGADIGATVQLEKVPLKYPGLRPWEIWLSEAQERMVFAIPPENWSAFKAICDGQDVEAVQIGTFGTLGARLTLRYADQPVGSLTMDFLHNGIPRRKLTATWEPGRPSVKETRVIADQTDALLLLLAHPNIRSKESIVRKFDHEVQGGTAVKPFVGSADHGPSDAAVIVPQDAFDPKSEVVKGLAVSNGLAPLLAERDPYLMAYAAVDEAMRNLVAVGADPDQVAILDNFCWGNPTLPDRLGSLVRCAQGCYDAALSYQVPFISGKDSLNNEYTASDGTKHAIPGTLLISALGIVPDARKSITMNFKKAGNLVYLIGTTRDEFGGGHYEQISGDNSGTPPQPVPDALETMRLLHRAINGGLILSCHDVSEGGIAVALAEMCIAGRTGAKVTLPNTFGPGTHKALFSESLCRFIVEIRPGDSFKIQRVLRSLATPLGTVRDSGELQIEIGGKLAIQATVEELEQVWRGEVKAAYPTLDAPRKLPKVTAKPPERRISTRTAAPKALILHANGSNRDHDAELALELAGAEPEIVHVNQLISGDRALDDYQMLVIPGGFSYGDDLGAGVVWALDLRNRLGDAVQKFVAAGRPVLGICNGFQALVKAGLLPGQPVKGEAERTVTLTYNESGRFECRWVYLQPVTGTMSLFTDGLTEPIYCPVAHGEGRIAVRDTATLDKLWKAGLVALTYIDAGGRPVAYPGNPNGSADGIAAICNPAGNVMGLMPHPENHLFAWQHPRREGRMNGLGLFRNAVKFA